MKLFLSADMEGTAGVTLWEETETGKRLYDHFARQMSSEVAAACEGAIAGGATEIVVKDAHDSACNIYPDMLPEQASILRSWARHPYSMMAGLDASFDGVMFTGYHSAASMPTNPLSHTMNGRNVYVKINDIICPELFINALTAAYEGKPIYLLTGDKGLCEWLRKMNANIPTVAVSEGMGGASLSINPHLAVKRIREAAEKALSIDPKKLMFPMPDHFRVEIAFRNHTFATNGSHYPGCVQLDSTRVAFESNDYMDVLKFFYWVL